MNFLAIGSYLLPLVVFLILLVGLWKKVPLFDTFVEGAKDGIRLGFQVFPCLLGMIFGVNLLLKSSLRNFIFLLKFFRWL